MKKFVMMIAGVSLIAMAACTGTSENAASGSKASAEKTSKASDASKPSKEAEKVGPVTLEMRNFTVDVPEGWKVKSEATNSANIEMIEAPAGKKCTFGFGMNMYAFCSTKPSVDDMVQTFTNVWKKGNNKFTVKPDYKLGDYTCKDLRMESQFSTKEAIIFSADEKLQFKIEINGLDLQDEQVQKVLQSLKVVKK